MRGAPVWSTTFQPWVTRFEGHGREQARLETAIDWSAPSTPWSGERAVLAASLRRFQLGEDGDGATLDPIGDGDGATLDPIGPDLETDDGDLALEGPDLDEEDGDEASADGNSPDGD